MSSNVANVDKRCLKYTMMHSILVRIGGYLASKTVCWILPKFDKLKNKVTYLGRCAEMNWDMRLTKKGQWVWIQIDTNDFSGDIKFCMLLQLNKVFSVERVGEGSREVYLLKFRDFGWDVLEGKPLLMFFIYGRVSVIPVVADVCDGIRTGRDRNKLGTELFQMYESQRFTDFVISVPGREYRVHKAILASRSEYFQNCLKGNVEGKIRLEASPDVMEDVIRFIYSRAIRVSNLEHVISVFYLAEELKLNSLPDLCHFHLLCILNKENGSRILEVAQDLGIHNLVEVAKKALEGKLYA